MTPFDVAQHEAAHLVVGLALGLKLRHAVLEPETDDRTASGYVWFKANEKTHRSALAIMFAAGAAWDQALGEACPEDLKLCRELVGSRHDVKTCVKAASQLLASLGPAHARVTKELLEKTKLTSKDIQAAMYAERDDEP